MSNILERIDEETSEQLHTGLPTLLEKMAGVFTSSEVSDIEDVTVPPNSAASTATSSTYVLTSSDRPLDTLVDVSTHSSLQCACFNCWKMHGSVKTWKSPDDVAIPQLPIFVKSPVDSIKILEKEGKCGATVMSMTSSADPSMASSSSSSSCSCTMTPPVTSATPINTTSGIVPETPTEWLHSEVDERRALASENAILREKIDLQADIIDKMLRLGALSDRLAVLRCAKCKSEHL